MKEKEYGERISIRDFNWRKIELKTKYKNACRPADTKTASVHYVHLVKDSKSFSPTNPEAIYLHARNLATGWQSSTRSNVRASIKSGNFIEDRRVADRMAKIDEIINKADLS